MVGSVLSLFCVCRFANSAAGLPLLLERRRSLTVGGELPALALPDEEVDVLDVAESCGDISILLPTSEGEEVDLNLLGEGSRWPSSRGSGPMELGGRDPWSRRVSRR